MKIVKRTLAIATLRSEPDPDSDKVGLIPRGESVEVDPDASQEHWPRISWNGQSGYCFGSYIGG